MASIDNKNNRINLQIDKKLVDILEEIGNTSGKSSREVIQEALKIINSATATRKNSEFNSLYGSRFEQNYREIIPALEVEESSKNKSTHRFPNQELMRSAPGIYLDRFHQQTSESFELSTASVIIPIRKDSEGILIQSIPLFWNEMIDCLQKDWGRIYELPPEKFEELIASTFDRAGYDEVVLTPRSGDHGRDVIAIKNGVGCIKIIGSVKRYAKDNRVRHDDVRALLGVLSGEQNSSKGLIVTTSDFQPGIYTDPYIKNFLPTRLELMNWEQLRAWLLALRDS